MPADTISVKQEEDIESDVREMHLKTEDSDEEMATTPEPGSAKEEQGLAVSGAGSNRGTPAKVKKQSRSPVKGQSLTPAITDSPTKSEHEETVGGDFTLKLEPGKPPKLERSRSHKVEKRPPQLFLDYENKTAEAKASFEVLSTCIYANKYLGSTDTSLECDCSEEWDSANHVNNACGEDSDCINRATKMECFGDCGCGSNCQNQRFQRKEYADVTVIKTEKKGYGLRANTDLKANDFVFEYIGEVIGESAFRRRMQQYDEEGIKHFYFMSLTKGEFVDATKKGNLGRFCNHSCNPNCYVDKWVVGEKLRMGVFTERRIQAGEELVFNYNVDRYGAEPQPCYCGEPNCTGYIGGKTQTERGTKLSQATIEALGIDDADAWDTAVAKRPRKKKASEDDEEYVSNIEPRGLDEDGVKKLMPALLQCKEKWIAVKLLNRIQRAEDERVLSQVIRFHGYTFLKSALNTWIEDVNIVLQILDILDRLPRLTKNKIQDSKIEEPIRKLLENEDERVVSQAQHLLDVWDKLELAYRIPRIKRDPNAAAPDRKIDSRRDTERRKSRSRSRTKSPERIQAPTGPRNAVPQRAPNFRPGPRPPRFRGPSSDGPLPPGWHEAHAANGTAYYYNATSGERTWQRPKMAIGAVPPPPPPKAISDAQNLQNLIQSIVSSKSETPKPQPSSEATPAVTPKKESKEDKWRSYPEDKQKKIYEGTLAPIVMEVANRYKNKLDRDDFKRFAKDTSKKLVNSDFKNNKVKSIHKIDEKHAKGIKKFTDEFFKKAVRKQQERNKSTKQHDTTKKDDDSHTPIGSPPDMSPAKEEQEGDLSDAEPDSLELPRSESVDSISVLKRPLEGYTNGTSEHSPKKLRVDTEAGLAPPPPPPPPPDEDEPMDDSVLSATDALHPFHQDAEDVNESNANGSRSDTRQGSEPLQTATPPTTGSPDREAIEKAVSENHMRMNPDRIRQLGLAEERR